MKIKCKGWRTNSCTRNTKDHKFIFQRAREMKEEIEISTYVEIREKGTSSGKS